MQTKTTKLNTQQVLENLDALKNKITEYDSKGFLLGGDSCHADLTVTIRDESTINIKVLQSNNIFSTLLLQYKIADILGNFDNSNVALSFMLNYDKYNKYHTPSYMYSFLSNAKDVKEQLIHTIEINNKPIIADLKQSLKAQQKQIENNKVSEDTLMYFLQKSTKNAIEEYSKQF